MENEWIKADEYSIIRINKYKDKFSIQMGSQGKEKVFVTWVSPLRYDGKAGESRPMTKADGSPMLVPLQIPLGTEKQAAIDVLKALLFQLTGEQAGDSQGQQEPPLPEGMPDDPCPF